MVNRSKKKGSQFETDCVEFLRAHGLPYAERRAQRGSADRGDIAGVIGWVLEVKNCAAMALAEWMKEAERESINDHSYRFAVIHKRKGRNVRDAYVTMPLWLAVEWWADPPVYQPRLEEAVEVGDRL